MLLFFSFDSRIAFPSHASCSPATVHNKTPHLSIYYYFNYSFSMIWCSPAHLFHLSSIDLHKKQFHLSLLYLSHACNSKQTCRHIKIHYHKEAFLSPTFSHFFFLLHILLIYFLSPPKLYTLVMQLLLILSIFLSTFFHPNEPKGEEWLPIFCSFFAYWNCSIII